MTKNDTQVFETKKQEEEKSFPFLPREILHKNFKLYLNCDFVTFCEDSYHHNIDYVEEDYEKKETFLEVSLKRLENNKVEFQERRVIFTLDEIDIDDKLKSFEPLCCGYCSYGSNYLLVM